MFFRYNYFIHMKKIAKKKIEEIYDLRKNGHSILEIVKISGISQTTVQRYVKNVQVPQKFLVRLREKQGGAKERAVAIRERITTSATKFLKNLSQRDKLLILTGLYWGEGTKKDFSIINSDVFLIQTILFCLRNGLKISENRFQISIRTHTDVNISEAKKFWSTATGIPINNDTRIEIINGKKKGKLPYGMCRVRVKSGVKERIFIQSLISLIGKEAAQSVVSEARSRSSMDRTAAS